jgi:hypothetical protein
MGFQRSTFAGIQHFYRPVLFARVEYPLRLHSNPIFALMSLGSTRALDRAIYSALTECGDLPAGHRIRVE